MRRIIFSFILIAWALLLTLQAQQISFPDKPNPVRFAAIGDMGTGDSAQYEVAQEMVAYHQKFPFGFVIMLGDNIYGGHDPSDFEQKFSTPYKPLLDAGVKFYAALGNHDDPDERFYKPFNMNGARYYTYKKGNVRFYALDSDYMDPPQLQWLEHELQKSGGDEWRICYFHHPLYSSGKKHGSSLELRALLEPLFIKYGVNAVFAGHDHVYERVKPENGINYFTEGAAGQLRYGDLKRTGLTDVGFDKDQSFMLLEVAGDDLYFQTVSRTGITVDSGMIAKKVGVQSAVTGVAPVAAQTPAASVPPKSASVPAATPALAQPSGRASSTVVQPTQTAASPASAVSSGQAAKEQSGSGTPVKTQMQPGTSGNVQATVPPPAKISPLVPSIKAQPKSRPLRRGKKARPQSKKAPRKKQAPKKPVAAKPAPG